MSSGGSCWALFPGEHGVRASPSFGADPLVPAQGIRGAHRTLIPIPSDWTKAQRKREHVPAWRVTKSEFELACGLSSGSADACGRPVVFQVLGEVLSGGRDMPVERDSTVHRGMGVLPAGLGGGTSEGGAESGGGRGLSRGQEGEPAGLGAGGAQKL